VLPSLTLALAVLAAGPARAQSPHDEWRTLDTGHFRVHYPLEAEAWVLQAAGRFEAIHAGVVDAVGYDPERVVDVVVMDPYAMANGFALPLLGTPRMGMFPSPPGADSSLSHYHDWGDDLFTHEDVHLVHMARHARNPIGATLVRYGLGIGPIALKTPLWAIEGYATMLEGQLTGAGRPYGPDRAAYLRALALEGRLPGYEDLNGGAAWQGGGVPYLVGSAFFEWLVAEHGEQSARDLWARLSARKIRFFDPAFEGVYGEPPAVLYERFCAELTHRAMTIEDQRPPQQGTLWQDMLRSTGAPALSPGGDRLAVVEDDETMGRRILILSTADNELAAEDWQASVDKLLARDPEDVAPQRPRVFPHEEIDRYAHGGRQPVDPRWLASGTEILFTSWVRQPSGDLLPELFLWDIEGGRARRLTRGGGVQDADPHPGGSFAVAVQQRWGESRLVRVDLDTGAITGLTPREVDTVHDQPRIQPGGQQVAWLRHRGAWEVALRDLSSGQERTLPLPTGAVPKHLAWDHDGSSLILSLALDGFVELYHQPLDGGPAARVSQTATAALAPNPDPTGAGIMFLVPDTRGYALHWLASGTPLPADTAIAPGAPAVPLIPASEPEDLPSTPFVEGPQDYGLGRAEWRPILGGSTWRGGDTMDLGLRVGDVVGRWEVLGLGSFATRNAPGGASLSAAYRGLPAELRAQLFTTTELGIQRSGAEVGAGILRFGDARWSRASAGVWTDLGHGAEADPYRIAAFASAAGGQRLYMGPAWLYGAAQIDGQQGTTRGAAWQLGAAQAEVGLGVGPVGLLGSYARSAISGGGPMDRLRLGGMRVNTLPGAYQATRMALPALGAGVAYGSDHDAWRASFDLERSLDLFVERHRIWDRASGLDPQAATLLGLELRTGSPSNPLARLPGLDMSVGVGCLLEHPDEGWRDKACLEKESWSAWVGLQWEL
jgi:hypothetical protein